MPDNIRARFKPKLFSTPMVLYVPELHNVNGVRQKTYSPHSELNPFFGSFSSYGGTERDINGVLVVDDTAIVETWYDPAIRADCAVGLADEGAADGEGLYEIISEPENIERRGQYSRFKVRRRKGGS